MTTRKVNFHNTIIAFLGAESPSSILLLLPEKGVVSKAQHSTVIMKSTKVQTSPIYRNHALEHLPQSTEPRAVLGSKYVMAKPTQFVKLSER